MLGRIFTVGGLTLVSRLTGFVRDIVLAAVLGAGPVADAFFVALRLPNHFRAIFAEGAFNAAFVPAYARIRQQQGADPAQLFADRIFALLLASQLVLLAIALVFTPGVIGPAGAGLRQGLGTVCAGGRSDADHVSVSAVGLAGDALRRHPQRARPFCGRRRGADPAQHLDGRDARDRSRSSRRPAMPRPGACCSPACWKRCWSAATPGATACCRSFAGRSSTRR